MYSEKTYKNYIFWLQVKRFVIIILLSCIGAALGVVVGKVLESTVKLTSFNNAIIIGSTVAFFLLSLLLTVGTGKQVQDGYWRIAVLRKLTVIQKDLEMNNELLKNSTGIIKMSTESLNQEMKEEKKEEDVDNSALYKFEETALVPQKKSTKNKKIGKKQKKLEMAK